MNVKLAGISVVDQLWSAVTNLSDRWWPIHLMDKNSDGAVSEKKFNAFHAERFKAIDIDKDGKVIKDEMTRNPHPMRGPGMTHNNPWLV